MTNRIGIWAVAVCACAVVAFGCKSGGQVQKFSKIELSPSTEKYQVETSAVTLGDSIRYCITITNTGRQRDLNVSSITLGYQTVTPDEGADPAFQLVDVPTLPAVVAPKGFPREGAPDSLTFCVKFKRYDDTNKRHASVTIVNDNTESVDRRNLVVTFDTVDSTPTLDVPPTVDFGPVHSGETPEKTLNLANTGSGKLEITKIRFEGDTNYSLTIGTKEFKAEPAQEGSQLDPAVTINPGTGAQWKVKFSPKSGDPAKATLIIFSNDPSAPDGKKVEIMANTSGPCIGVMPMVDFGGKLIHNAAQITVNIKSCGTGPLDVTNISLKADSSPDFKLIFDKIPGYDAGNPDKFPSQSIAVNDSIDLVVQFTPDVKNPLDPQTGQPIKDTGTIIIANNTFEAELNVGLIGFGVEVECPQPIIVIEEGEEVQPQTTLHLHGDQSQASTGQISQYTWKVEQPSDNKFNLLPTLNFPNPTHEVNIAGTYTYCLDVCDSSFCSNDTQCNTTACKKVVVVPNQAIHCELTWNTPGDLNQFDEGPDAGSDMDLHFVHPFATGPDLDSDGKPDGWFDIPYDCFWYNPNPEWESLNANVKDNPSLDRDDTDGAGPENVNLDVPVNGRSYRVGVHYWDAHGYGASFARVKCFIWGQPVLDWNLEDQGIKMFECDMWEVATIDWPTGKVTKVLNSDGTLKITHKYQNPAFVQISGGTCTP
jgi:hypothetical protein